MRLEEHLIAYDEDGMDAGTKKLLDKRSGREWMKQRASVQIQYTRDYCAKRKFSPRYWKVFSANIGIPRLFCLKILRTL